MAQSQRLVCMSVVAAGGIHFIQLPSQLNGLFAQLMPDDWVVLATPQSEPTRALNFISSNGPSFTVNLPAWHCLNVDFESTSYGATGRLNSSQFCCLGPKSRLSHAFTGCLPLFNCYYPQVTMLLFLRFMNKSISSSLLYHRHLSSLRALQVMAALVHRSSNMCRLAFICYKEIPSYSIAALKLILNICLKRISDNET
ncbi:unnamed protein product [Protopolystoma xenopodis]|uniref:Uncharacterized protein n=1 Tax=Protopolystoma xenopodis TaxID=117903 RepID=A0A448XP01_9PLAT|nr:unnamed protein product [Protopolystoma xenopodis]